MPIKMCTRVCRSFVVLALAIFALNSRDAAATPLFMGTPGALCGDLVSITTQNCGLFVIDDLSQPAAISGTFQHDNDVALLQFVITEAASVFAATSGSAVTAFDPLIGLFHATGTIVRYFNEEQQAVVDAENDDAIPGETLDAALPPILLEPGTYYLAVLQVFNTFSQGADGIDSLRAGFGFDDEADYMIGLTGDLGESCVTRVCDFSLTLTADSGGTPSPVPEPNTMALVAFGAAAALVRRLRRRERQL